MSKNETDSKNEITIGIGWLDTILNLIKRYSILEILKAIILLLVLSMTIRICINPSIIFDTWKEWEKRDHDIELAVRAEKDEALKDYLTLWQHKYHADRIFIIQYHNGTKDWQHGTMRFEKCGNNIASMKSCYVNFNLTWLDIPFYLKEKDLFIGSMVELKSIDSTLYNQLLPYDVDFLACILIRNEYGEPSGIFGCTWGENDIDMATREQKIHDYLIEDRGIIRDLTK